MGNDPINSTDRDGAYSWFGAWWRNGFSSKGLDFDYDKQEWGFYEYAINPSAEGSGGFNWEITPNFGVSYRNQILDRVGEMRYNQWLFSLPTDQRIITQYGGNGIETVNIEFEAALLVTTWGIGNVAAKGGYSTIYRTVSQAEVDDIAKFGFRMKAGGYESGKLFAPTLQEATQFGKYNFGLDGIPNMIMKVKVPNSVLNGATKFGADGMNAISIPANQLKLLKGTPLNYSPLIR
jgi:hypothetical protein